MENFLKLFQAVHVVRKLEKTITNSFIPELGKLSQHAKAEDKTGCHSCPLRITGRGTPITVTKEKTLDHRPDFKCQHPGTERAALSCLPMPCCMLDLPHSPGATCTAQHSSGLHVSNKVNVQTLPLITAAKPPQAQRYRQVSREDCC